MAAAKGVKIDHLLLDIPGSSANDARRIAQLVAAGLAAAGGLAQSGDLPTVRIAINAERNASPDAIARRIVAATLRELARVP